MVLLIFCGVALSKFGFYKNEEQYTTHVELFTDAKDENLKNFLNNQKEDGTESFTRYILKKDTCLEPYIKSSKELKAGTPIKNTGTSGSKYARVKVKALVKELENGRDISVQIKGKKADGSNIYHLDTIAGKSRTRYKIVTTQFEYVNKLFNGLLDKDSYVYWDSKGEG